MNNTVFTDDESNATLQDVLVFATGINEPPPMGFDTTLNLEFTTEKSPLANTYGLTLLLPCIMLKTIYLKKQWTLQF